MEQLEEDEQKTRVVQLEEDEQETRVVQLEEDDVYSSRRVTIS